MRINAPSLGPKFSFLPTAYVVRREGYVLTRFCLYTPGGGGTPARSSRGRGVPQPGPAQGIPLPGEGEYLLLGGRCTPPQVPPHQTWSGYPLPGRPHLTSCTPPLSDLAGGRPPAGRGVPPARGRGTPTLGIPPIGPGRGVPHFWKHMEYLIRRGRYASCVRAGGLSCYAFCFWKKTIVWCPWEILVQLLLRLIAFPKTSGI